MSSGRPAASSPSHGGSRSGSQYALCALGVGLIALGVVMIVWTVVPQDADASSENPGPAGNATSNATATSGGAADDGEEAGDSEKSRKASSSVAYVLVGAGTCMLLLSICLGVRSKRKERQRAGEAAAPFMEHVAGEPDGAGEPVPTYDVPSYEEAVGSGQYPISQSNLRHSTSQLPSYEDLISAVENEGEGPSSATPAAEDPPTVPAASEPQPQPAPSPASASLPSRSGSRASRILRPLRVRRIKSDKLHLKDFRLMIRNPTHAPVTIEPITPPPQYDDKMPEF